MWPVSVSLFSSFSLSASLSFSSSRFLYLFLFSPSCFRLPPEVCAPLPRLGWVTALPDLWGECQWWHRVEGSATWVSAAAERHLTHISTIQSGQRHVHTYTQAGAHACTCTRTHKDTHISPIGKKRPSTGKQTVASMMRPWLFSLSWEQFQFIALFIHRDFYTERIRWVSLKIEIK